MYSHAARLRALKLIEQGQDISSVSMTAGISRTTLQGWRDHPARVRITCPRCETASTPPGYWPSYAYLLGLYLGDGCISRAGDERKGVWVLRIICADAWPGLQGECKQAMQAVRPDNVVGTQQGAGCTVMRMYSKHWTCFFPQHGTGRKHERKIELEPWQQAIVTAHAGEFARGLFHSDGCRLTNRVCHMLTEGGRVYEYPRYLFVNRSDDILRLCGEALDRLGVAWRFSKPTTISVARREAVARLDEFVGPKY